MNQQVTVIHISINSVSYSLSELKTLNNYKQLTVAVTFLEYSEVCTRYPLRQTDLRVSLVHF